jgi:DNA-binding HxlR family transcriptional regulator
MKYGQFCPIAKATELLGERWTLLIVREFVAGATRYAELERALGRISPSVLSARLKSLLESGIIEREDARAGRGVEYRLTPAGRELAPIVDAVGTWGQRWVRSKMTRDELDVELLMVHQLRALDTSALAPRHVVLEFVFEDLHGPLRTWWILLDDDRRELCAAPPGRAADVVLTGRLRTLSEVFVGDSTLGAALASGRLQVRGRRELLKSMPRWLRPSPLAAVAPAETARASH